MENIKKFFNDKLYFYSGREEDVRYNNIMSDAILSIVYKSNKINEFKEIGIDDYLDLAYKLKPFYYYLFSKYRNEIPLCHSYKITFKVILSFDTDEFFTLINEYEMLELKEPFF